MNRHCLPKEIQEKNRKHFEKEKNKNFWKKRELEKRYQRKIKKWKKK